MLLWEDGAEGFLDTGDDDAEPALEALTEPAQVGDR